MDKIKRMGRMRAAIDAVIAERDRQDDKWGEQNHPLVCHPFFDEPNRELLLHILRADLSLDATIAKRRCDAAHRHGHGTFAHILAEEFAEYIEASVIHGDESDEALGELVQTVAVGLAMIERIYRKLETSK